MAFQRFWLSFSIITWLAKLWLMYVASSAKALGWLMASLLPSDASIGASAAFSLTVTISKVALSLLSRKTLLPCRTITTIPGVDRSRRAHEHGENAVCGENGSFILLSQLLNDRVRRSCDVVCSAIELALVFGSAVLTACLSYDRS